MIYQNPSTYNTPTHSGKPNFLNQFAMFKLKPEALMEDSTAALASLETANQARDKEAQNMTQKANFTGFSSESSNLWASSAGSKHSSEEEEALVWVNVEGAIAKGGLRREEALRDENERFDLRDFLPFWMRMRG